MVRRIIPIALAVVTGVHAQAVMNVRLRMPVREYLETLPGFIGLRLTCPNSTCQKVNAALMGEQVVLPLNPESMDWEPLQVAPEEGYYRDGYVMTASRIISVIQVHMSPSKGDDTRAALHKQFGKPSESRAATKENPTWSETWTQANQTWIFAYRGERDWLTLEDGRYVRWLKAHPGAAAYPGTKVIDSGFDANGRAILLAVVLDDFNTYVRGGQSLFRYGPFFNAGAEVAKREVQTQLADWFALGEWPAFAKRGVDSKEADKNVQYLFLVYWAGTHMNSARDLAVRGAYGEKYLTESGKVDLAGALQRADEQMPEFRKEFLTEYQRCRVALNLPTLPSSKEGDPKQESH